MAAIAFRSATPKSGFSLVPFASVFAGWNDRRVTRKSLKQLSARQLDDIGLNYGDIEAIATGTFNR